MDIEIVPIEDRHLAGVFSALGQAFGGRLDHEWFQWKHRSGPWGPSPGWVATDPDGVVGVRLFLPWRFRRGSREFTALRPCDTVTVPRAQGRGVFRMLTEHALSQVQAEADFLFNTPNSQSKPGYLKMGFVEWGTVDQRMGVVGSALARINSEPTVPDDEAETLSTWRSEQFLDWRYRRCPVGDYQIFGLSDADLPNGIVVRGREWRGRRVVIVDECWGGERQERALIRAACHQLGTALAWIGARHARAVPFSMKRRATSVTRYDLGDTVHEAHNLSVGDVESVL